MVPSDYASEDVFFRKLAAYLGRARDQGFLGPRTVVVFPEYLGAWLVALEEKESLYRAATADQAMWVLASSNLLSFLRWLPFAHGAEDAALASIFRMKSKQMAEAYERSFGRLAREFGVTIVAGSIVLPEPKVRAGRLELGHGPLYNTTLVFDSRGKPMSPAVRKVHPVQEERPFMAPASMPEPWPVFETPAGRLAVMICADSWYPEPYAGLGADGVDLIVVPSYLSKDDDWSRKWPGFGDDMPEDVDPRDVGTIQESDAWIRYALAGRFSGTPARAGINVFLKGRLWDLGSAGRTIAVSEGRVIQGERVSGASLFNLWLDES
jgi:predicted amidohydrolase